MSKRIQPSEPFFLSIISIAPKLPSRLTAVATLAVTKFPSPPAASPSSSINFPLPFDRFLGPESPPSLSFPLFSYQLLATLTASPSSPASFTDFANAKRKSRGNTVSISPWSKVSLVTVPEEPLANSQDSPLALAQANGTRDKLISNHCYLTEEGSPFSLVEFSQHPRLPIELCSSARHLKPSPYRDDHSGDKKMGIKTSVLEGKATACTMLCCYANEMKEGSYPWIDKVGINVSGSNLFLIRLINNGFHMNLLLVCRSLQQTLVEKENEQRELKCRTLAQKKRNSQRKNEQEEEVFDQVGEILEH
ncbi:hypothetical protein M9H77_26931 [Catharanthus roseus]|uniref:Uncharacterized protein n=1 Tax=Catharanthus roseus TaxID=4058 RepID=A0ACC0AB34_CATRO|nr:hypothetical protein M9H77_26931 [Catharanthus roseus]